MEPNLKLSNNKPTSVTEMKYIYTAETRINLVSVYWVS